MIYDHANHFDKMRRILDSFQVNSTKGQIIPFNGNGKASMDSPEAVVWH